MPLARFIAFHEVPENAAPPDIPLSFAIVIARATGGVVLVFNRHRRVWELPGGLIDPGESPRESAQRELAEEAGCHADSLDWLGIVEVDDGRRHAGAVFACEVAAVPATLSNEEIDGLDFWTPAAAPAPVGESDQALLTRFARSGLPDSARPLAQ
jgi:8-oxo-dGTP diphosphatase